MSAELPDRHPGLEAAQVALDDLHTSQDEFEQFFGNVFDELQSLSLELFARHKYLEVTTQGHEAERTATAETAIQLEKLLEQMQAARNEMQANREEDQQAWAEWRAAHEAGQKRDSQLAALEQQLDRLASELQTNRDELGRDRAELRTMHEATAAHLARLASIAAELSAVQAQAGENANPAQQKQFEQILEDARQREAQWHKERAELELELKQQRNHALELNSALAEQKRQSTQHQAELSGELKRVRSMLESISGQIRSPSTAGSAPDKRDPNASSDPVLDAVLAQFEMLQKDVVRRRSSKTATPNTGEAASKP